MVKLEHVGIAVEDGSEASRTFERLFGSRPYKTERVEREGVETTFIDAGGPKLELLTSITPGSAVAKYLKNRGEGVHHIAIEVDNIESELARVRDDGFAVLSEHPLEGADGKRIFFVHPRDCHGILVEFCQHVRPAWQRRNIKTSGGTVTVYTAGSEEATPVLLMRGDDASWEAVEVDRLAPALERSLYVVSFQDQMEADTERTQTIAKEVLNYCGVDRPSVIVGCGPVCADALDFVQSNRKRVRALVVIDPRESILERFEAYYPGDRGGRRGIPLLVCAVGSESASIAVEAWRGVPGARLSVIPEIEDRYRQLAEQIVEASRWT